MSECSLPSLSADNETVTISGISSGSFMTTILHLANSDKIKGSGHIICGPYHRSEFL